MDIRKIERDLGWRPRQTLHDGLLKTVTWYLDHPQWVSTILQSGDFTSWMERNYTKREAGKE
jgi:dTDP-glucose 4,6-dehydratase